MPRLRTALLGGTVAATAVGVWLLVKDDPGHALMTIFAVVFGVALLATIVGGVAMSAVQVGVLGWYAARGIARGTRRLVTGDPGRPDAPPDTGPDWAAARQRLAGVRTGYAAYECDPLAVLARPALADVRVESTARFVDAFAEAQALDTDARPPPAQAEAFVAAVDRAARAWAAAGAAAERIGLARLGEAERATVQKAVTLLTLARHSDHPGERLTAYGKARDLLARLERRGVLTLPRTARAALDRSTRGPLPRTVNGA